MSQLSELNALAQTGQELSRETLWPAEITIAGETVQCSGGSLQETGAQLVSGGSLGDFALGFRVRRELLAAAPVPEKTLLTYQGRSWLIVKVVTDPRDNCYVIGADNPSK